MQSHYDVIVSGGGLAGVAAAVAAAREGAKTLLIERYGFLGGMATAGLVNPFMPYWTEPREEYGVVVNAGLFGQMLEELDSLGGLHPNRLTFDEELLKLVLDRMCARHGVDVLLHSFICGVDKDGDRIARVKLANKDGEVYVSGAQYIDATGDGDVAALFGCPFEMGRESDGLSQPMTMNVRIANVDPSKYMPTGPEGPPVNQYGVDKRRVMDSVNRVFQEAKRQGRIKNARDTILSFPTMTEDTIHFNSTRIVQKSSVDALEMTQAEMEAREQAYELYAFLQESIPGFENSRLQCTAPQTGVRESRRVLGDYVIQVEDLTGIRKFEDAIARGTYAVDIHDPKGGGAQLGSIPAGQYYTIPYRALLPRGADNLIIAGRPISGTHEAHSAYRIMPITTCIGEAAGIAAAMAVRGACAPRRIDVLKLREKIQAHGGLC